VTAALFAYLERLARDVGCLRRRTDPEAPTYFLVERIADSVESLDVMVFPCAAELRVEFLGISGDDGLSTEEALRIADDRRARLRRLLGREER
jgi:hypothetical protein